MRNQEVELIDYLRVMWWGKWIVLGCIAVAIGLGALYAVLQPTTFSGAQEILLREYVTAAAAGDREATAALDAAISSTLEEVMRAVSGVDARRTEDRIALKSRGRRSEDAVRDALMRAENILNEQLPMALEEELGYLAAEMRFQEGNLTAQLAILQQRLAEERVTLDAPTSEALANRIAGLEVELAQIQVRLHTLESSDASSLFTLRSIGEPTNTASVPKRTTTIAVAGLLGLIVGVLFAFFVHYLLQVRARERHASE
jgi:LPS O-antigen subunit length determinant protein (WzzB/FepE family)